MIHINTIACNKQVVLGLIFFLTVCVYVYTMDSLHQSVLYQLCISSGYVVKYIYMSLYELLCFIAYLSMFTCIVVGSSL